MLNRKKFLFWFRCRSGKCGQYRTTRKILDQFLTPKLRRRLEHFLESDRLAAGAILEFAHGCPRCERRLESEATLISIRRKVSGLDN